MTTDALAGPLPAPGKPADRRPQRLSSLSLERIGIAVLTVLVALGFTLYTGHVGEDFLITFRHSPNLVDGKGLVYYPGERVHGFTSPPGTLLPALGYALCGSASQLMLQAFPEADGPGNRVGRAFFAAFFLLQTSIIDFAINGMETAFLLLFLAWGVLLVLRGVGPRWLGMGQCWAGLMWTRPDGCDYVAVLAMATLLFRQSTGQGRVLPALLRAAVCAVVYLPWFCWTWWYYGSPVPHTILAKAHPDGAAAQLRRALGDLYSRFFSTAASAFMPTHVGKTFHQWRPGMVGFAETLGVFAALSWLFPAEDRLGRLASVCFALLTLYLSTLQVLFPWYLPPAALLGLVAIARGALALPPAFRRGPPHWKAVALLVLGIVAAQRLTLFSLNAVQLRAQQTEIEDRTRTRIDQWLREHGKPTDTIFLEPIGYIGYFSGTHIADYPGLVSPEVVRLRRQGQRTFGQLIAALRPAEVAPLKTDRGFLASYHLVKAFDARERLARRGDLPGKNYLLFDAVYLVFRRTDLPALPAEASLVEQEPEG